MKSSMSVKISRLCIAGFLSMVAVGPAISAANLSKAEVNSLLAKLSKEVADNGYTYTVGPTSVIDRPLEEICGLDLSQRQYAAPASEEEGTGLEKTAALPAVFDLNAMGKCTPVRDQQYCGSCWDFASVGAYETSLLFLNNITADLSEQFVLKCNFKGYSCNGGWCAFETMAGGTPLETCAPYNYKNGAAGCSCPKLYPMKGFYTVNNDTASIKQAIFSRGGVWVGVAATPAFQGYSGGVFNNNDPSAYINHAVVLVGWDNTKKAWRLRNSWGTGWGENGYMWIKFGCNQVGSYAEYAVPAAGNGLVPPSYLTAKPASISQINLAWAYPSITITGFYIERKSGKGAYVQIDSVKSGITTYSSKGLKGDTLYTYRVRAYAAGGKSSYSNEAATLATNLAAPTTLVATTQTIKKIKLSWKCASTAIAGFSIERKMNTGSYSVRASTGVSVLTYIDSNLSPQTIYTYRIRAYSATVHSNYSPEISDTTVIIPKPAGLAAKGISSSGIRLSWSPVSGVVDSYSIEFHWYTVPFAVLKTVGSGVTTYTQTNFVSGSKFYFRIRAKIGKFYGAYSSEVTASTLAGSAPGVSLVPNQLVPNRTYAVCIIDARGCCIKRFGMDRPFDLTDVATMRLAPGFYIARMKSGQDIIQQRFTVRSH